MKTRFLLIALLAQMCIASVNAQEPLDVIVKNDLETLKVYNVEVSSNFVFYQLAPEAGAVIQKLPIADVMLIRKADGTKIDPSAVAKKTTESDNATSMKKTRSRILVPVEPHEPVQAEVCSEIKVKKERREFEALNPDGCKLKYRILSEEQHTLAVIENNYKLDSVIIPETVGVSGVLYTVTRIDAKAFNQTKLKSCQFPKTLTSIGAFAFNETRLKRILLPEGLKEIDDYAFYAVSSFISGDKGGVRDIYIPTTVSKIGKYAFLHIGNKKSHRGFYQGIITCLPDWINENNCTSYGIDENAVEDYEKRLNGEE